VSKVPSLPYQRIIRALQISGPRALTDCGSAEWQVRWDLRNMRQNGWIIQYILWEADVTDCNGNPRRPRNPDGREFWEAWEVRNGRIWVGIASRSIAHRADTFRTVEKEKERQEKSRLPAELGFTAIIVWPSHRGDTPS
jgi:hypothetical protein